MCDEVVVELWPSFTLGRTVFALGDRYETWGLFRRNTLDDEKGFN